MMMFGYLAVNSGVARMRDWFKRKSSPAPSEHSLESKEQISLTDVRLERMLDRLGSDRSERREPVAETLNKIDAPPSTDSVAGSEPVTEALNEIDSLPSADSIIAGERAARALNAVDPPLMEDWKQLEPYAIKVITFHSGRPLSEITPETVPASATPKRSEPDCSGHLLPTDASEAAPEPSPEPTLSSTSERALQRTVQSVPLSTPEPMLEGTARSSADLVAQKSGDSAAGKQQLIQAAPDALAAWLGQDRPEFKDAGVFDTDALRRKPVIISLSSEPMHRHSGEIRTEVELLYRELEDHMRANNVEGIRQIYHSLLQAGRSVSEITEIMHTYTLKSASKSELKISPNNELPQRAARPKSSSELTASDSDSAVRSDTPRGSSDIPNLADESEPRDPKGHAQFSHPSSVRRFAALRSPIAQLAIIGVAAIAGGLLLLHPAGEKLAVMATSILHPSSRPSDGASLTLMMWSALPPEHAPELTTTGPMPAPATTPRDEGPQTSAAAPATLLKRGDLLFGERDVNSARLYYERAADAGDAQAALKLGETYDPSFLAWARLNNVRGDSVVAARWYRRARDLGASEAEILLKSLQAN